ncbi:MAG: SDR family oxidoreductase [Gemmatimonadetes bacterium]|jgi:NAD(P)-dependent dehydrogenase (short-subunit alcohol dehydrogenase family)|nr:SDR family oxidoreductase [Gemmatimonadota bacterium]MBT5324884.1 SDR family oxidoreductase [Gemmatimonadota bacterium]MBT5447844.1 SDR family oxidoreductase [Gemmatimonadota bacterium]MBT5803537.1 SDR family oxidoreductase [Gemmatimonadota bacterium]MBT6619425.1 SDR family oxidoreductase [Gemmatimonadota bacterium]
MKLKDKVALITGGSSGIGRAAAVAMAREGAKVALTARRAERCQEAVDEIERMGGEALALPGDVADAEHVEALVAATVERWGRLDIVVPNAGINGVLAPIEDITPEEWDQTQNINVRGTFLTVKYAIPHLRAAGGGSIVVVSSVNGNRIFSNFGFTSYSCSKAAQVTFAKMAAVELAQWAIRINVVCPGWTKTSIGENTFARDIDKIKIPREYPEGMVPLQQRPASSEEVANVILFLASNEASYVTGTEIYVDGALSLFQG